MNPALRLARREAANSRHTYKVGAVAYRGRGIICSSFNQVKTNPVRTRHKRTINKLHAEMGVLRNSKNLNGATVVIVRINKNNHGLTMAKPCRDCAEMLLAAGVRKIIYSNFAGEMVRERL